MNRIFLFSALFLSYPAIADEQKTVILTQEEVTAYTNAVQTQAAAAIAAAQAKNVFEKMKAAFPSPQPQQN